MQKNTVCWFGDSNTMNGFVVCDVISFVMMNKHLIKLEHKEDSTYIIVEYLENSVYVNNHARERFIKFSFKLYPLVFINSQLNTLKLYVRQCTS